jgi:xylulokinase
VTYLDFSADYSLSFHRISTSTTKQDLARAVNEGLVLYAYQTASRVLASGVGIDQVRVGAGGAANRVSNQIRADVYGTEVGVPQTLNVGCLGAAVYAAVSAGIYGSIRDAIPKMVRIVQIYTPRDKIHSRYLRIFEKFEQIATRMQKPT